MERVKVGYIQHKVGESQGITHLEVQTPTSWGLVEATSWLWQGA